MFANVCRVGLTINIVKSPLDVVIHSYGVKWSMSEIISIGIFIYFFFLIRTQSNWNLERFFPQTVYFAGKSFVKIRFTYASSYSWAFFPKPFHVKSYFSTILQFMRIDTMRTHTNCLKTDYETPLDTLVTSDVLKKYRLLLSVEQRKLRIFTNTTMIRIQHVYGRINVSIQMRREEKIFSPCSLFGERFSKIGPY